MTDPIAASEAAFSAGTDAISTAQQAAVAQEIARKADSDALLAKIDERLKEYVPNSLLIQT